VQSRRVSRIFAHFGYHDLPADVIAKVNKSRRTAGGKIIIMSVVEE
jgi:hypothetical protein